LSKLTEQIMMSTTNHDHSVHNFPMQCASYSEICAHSFSLVISVIPTQKSTIPNSTKIRVLTI